MKGKEVHYPADARVRKKVLGNYHAAWCIAPDHIKETDVIYSFGVGTDISFDLDLIAQYRCQVFAFDPTPRSIAWIAKQRLPEKLCFQDVGVAGTDGVIRFYPPANPDHVSFSTNIIHGASGAVELPVARLRSIMDKLGHQRIALLKMDIEGSEYEVIDDIIKSGIEVGQLLVEFHHRFDLANLGKTRKAIDDLKRNGYRIFYISPSGEEYSFIKLKNSD